MNTFRTIICLCVLGINLSSCIQEEVITLDTAVKEQFYLVHEGAQMPILVEGNTASKTFILVVHGGPGGNAMVYNDFLSSFSDPLERNYAMVYWDQRGSGNALGNYGPEALTVEQYVEDLDVLIALLFSRYGVYIHIFLMGHSWGGTLTAAYLSEEGKQDQIAGWIEVGGAHNIPLINETAPGLLIQMGQEQIQAGNRVEEWEEIVDFCENLNSDLTIEEIIRINQFGNEAERYMIEAKITTQGTVDAAQALDFYFSSNHNFVTSFFNSLITGNRMFEKIVFSSYSERMARIQIPCLFLWGKFDLIVPPILAEDAYNSVSTPMEDKSIYIFEHSGHSPMVQQAEEFGVKVEQFVEKYR